MSETRVIQYEIKVDDAPVKSLKQQLREATLEAQRLATAEVVDEKALQAAIQKTAELKDQMMDVNEQVMELAAGSPFEKMKNSIGGVQGALMNLDFDKATTSAKALTNTIASLNPATMATQFAAFGGTIMQLGRAVGMLTVKFVQMGLALLANPIFLLVAAIVAIVAAIVIFLDKIGVLQVILDAIMAPINLLIDGFYALTDAIGITSKAAEEEAEKIKSSYEKSSKAIEERGKILEAQVGNELELLKARSTGTEEDLEKIRKKEEQLLFVKQKGAQDSLKLAQSTLNAMKNNSEITEEELEKQRLLVLDLQLAYDKAKTASLSYFAQRISDAAKAKTAADEKAAAEEKKKSEEAAANAKKAREESRKRAEEEAKLLIERTRFLKDIELNGIEDDRQRELAIAQEKIKREEEDLRRSVNWSRYSKEQQEQITKDFQNREKQLIVNFNAQTEAIETAKREADALAEKEKRDKEIAALEDHRRNMFALEMQYQQAILDENDFETKNTLLQKQYDEELRLLKQSLDAKELSQEEYDARVKLLDVNLAKSKKENNDKEIQQEKDLRDKKIEMAFAASNAIMGLINALAKDNEQSARRMFKINKAYQLGQAVANTALAITGALTAGGNPIKLATGAQFIEAGIVAVNGAAQIATIAKTKFEGGSATSPSVMSGGGGATPSMGQAQSTPQINMFQNEQTGGQMSGVNKVSVVDYTDIQTVGKNVAMLQNAVSLG